MNPKMGLIVSDKRLNKAYKIWMVTQKGEGDLIFELTCIKKRSKPYGICNGAIQVICSG